MSAAVSTHTATLTTETHKWHVTSSTANQRFNFISFQNTFPLTHNDTMPGTLPKSEELAGGRLSTRLVHTFRAEWPRAVGTLRLAVLALPTFDSGKGMVEGPRTSAFPSSQRNQSPTKCSALSPAFRLTSYLKHNSAGCVPAIWIRSPKSDHAARRLFGPTGTSNSAVAAGRNEKLPHVSRPRSSAASG